LPPEENEGEEEEEEGLLTCTAFSDAASVGHFDKGEGERGRSGKG